jgi:hypothetical protein
MRSPRDLASQAMSGHLPTLPSESFSGTDSVKVSRDTVLANDRSAFPEGQADDLRRL